MAEGATGLTEAFDVVIDLLQDPGILQLGVARWCGRGCGMGGRWLGLIRDRWVGKRGFGLTSVWRQTRRGKRRTGRAGAGWQILDLLKAGYTFERDLGLNCLLLSQCISYRRKMKTGRAGAGCQNLDLLKPGYSFGRDSSFWTSVKVILASGSCPGLAPYRKHLLLW